MGFTKLSVRKHPRFHS